MNYRSFTVTLLNMFLAVVGLLPVFVLSYNCDINLIIFNIIMLIDTITITLIKQLRLCVPALQDKHSWYKPLFISFCWIFQFWNHVSPLISATTNQAEVHLRVEPGLINAHDMSIEFVLWMLTSTFVCLSPPFITS